MADVRAYLIAGNDAVAVEKDARERIEAFLPEDARAMGLESFDGAVSTSEAVAGVLKRCLEALMTSGLFSSRKVAWLRQAVFLSADAQTGRGEDVKAVMEQLVSCIKDDRIPAEHMLIITAPSVDQRTSLCKAFQKHGAVLEHKVPESGGGFRVEQEWRAVVEKSLSDAGISARGAAVESLLNRVGRDTQVLASEVAKVKTYMGARSEMTEDDVDAVVCDSGAFKGWDLADAVGRRETERALKIARRLIDQKESPIGLVAMVASRIRELRIYREATDKGWLRMQGRGGAVWSVPADVEELFKNAFDKDPRAGHPYRMSLLAAQAQGFTPAALLRCERETVRAQRRLVTGDLPRSMQPMVVEEMIVRMLS